jgi:hypothetical protein
VTTDTISHQVNRLVIDVAGPFEAFRRCYEQAAPPIHPEQIPAWVGRQAPWDEVLAAAEAAAPYGFLIYTDRHLPRR